MTIYHSLWVIDRSSSSKVRIEYFLYVRKLLQISELSHTVINALSFRVEYRRGSGGTAMFQRQVRFQIDLSDVTNTHSPRDYLFAIIFTLHSGTYLLYTYNRHKMRCTCCYRLTAIMPPAATFDYIRFVTPSCRAGNIRRFRRVCEHIQTQMCARKAPSSPRATRKFNTDLSESSSCGSDTSERLSPYVNIRNVSIEIIKTRREPAVPNLRVRSAVAGRTRRVLQ